MDLAVGAFVLGIPISALTVLQSLYQGTILNGRATRGIPESLAAFLLVFLLGLGAGVISGQVTGLYVGIGALTLANIAQTLWVWFRSRPITKRLRERDSA